MVQPAKNTICLWYDGDAEDAARFYARTFPDSSVGAVHRAASTYRQPSPWKALIRNAMAEDFSWDASAREYVTLYRKALKARSGSSPRRSA